MANLLLQLKSYRLTLAEILYHMPDHPGLLQSFIWQDMDRAPDFPRLTKFLDFWVKELDGPLHSVTVGGRDLISDGSLRLARAEYLVN